MHLHLHKLTCHMSHTHIAFLRFKALRTACVHKACLEPSKKFRHEKVDSKLFMKKIDENYADMFEACPGLDNSELRKASIFLHTAFMPKATDATLEAIGK
jgi:hypothetical protein